MKTNYEPYEMAVTHYLDTVDDYEYKFAHEEAETMRIEHGESWVINFCEEYGLTVYN